MKPNVLRGVAKAGYAARGIVYLIVGGLAVLAAVGQGGETTSTRGALLSLLDSGIGSILLVAIALGLFCYAGWRLLQALLDADEHGTNPKALTVRGALLVSAATHTGLGVWALAAVISGSGGNGGGHEGFAAWLMQQPYGPWLVGLVGCVICGAGLAHGHKGVTRGYEQWFTADDDAMRLIRPVASTGLVARGMVFLIVGGLFIYAGVTIDPERAGGLRDALQWLQGFAFGNVLLLAIALGLVCFGAYSLIEAVYRRIKISEALPDSALDTA